MPQVPLHRDALDAIFLDAGNTLVSMDFEWIHRELAVLGVATTLEHLSRADWRARPSVSQRCEVHRRTEGGDLFVHVLADLLGGLPTTVDAVAVAKELAAKLRVPGYNAKLWSRPLPGARRGLEALKGLGLRLIVVSNSDGTVDRALEGAGLLDLLDAVVYSKHVGAEKPDRRIFDHAVQIAGCARDRVLHVGDLYSADILGARGAGIAAALVDPHRDYGTDVDCPVIEGVEDLARILGAFSN